MTNNTFPQVVLAGHPFSPSGRGEDVRTSFRALTAAGLRPKLLDIYGMHARDARWAEEFGPHLVREAGPGINFFHLNGDEIDQALRHLGLDARMPGFNVVQPQWELSQFPEEWARQLDRFDEIWTPSRFIFDSVGKVARKPVVHLTQGCETRVSTFYGRRYFGIPEDRYVFLFFFDFTSYIQRKNPFAALAAFERLLAERPEANVSFVIKLNNSHERSKERDQFEEGIARYRERLVILDKTLTDDEMKNLVRCCDCFVSLHRSEGYGRGLAEAMYLGKPVIATAYSGNMDFTAADAALLVDYRLVEVGAKNYPHGAGQVWADADVDKAAAFMVRLIDDPDWGREVGARASRHMRQHFSYLATGLRYRTRMEEILAAKAAAPKATPAPAKAQGGATLPPPAVSAMR